MKRNVALMIGLVILAAAASFAQQDASGLHKTNRILEEELALAKSPNFYFMFNLADKTIALKSKGVALRNWKVGRVRIWGKPVEFKALELARKSALVLPKRKIIKPGEPETVAAPAKPGQFELEALEVKDMPESYTLELSDGTEIDVSPKKRGVPRVLDEIRWSIGFPLKALRLSLRKKSATTIGVTFEDPKDGQALYWALTEGLKGLVWFPHQ